MTARPRVLVRHTSNSGKAMNNSRITASPILRSGAPRTNYVIDCDGAWITVRKRAAATVLTIDGEIDTVNTQLFHAAVRRYAALRCSVILDLSALDFLNVGGFHSLVRLRQEYQRDDLFFIVISGGAVRPLLRAVADHGLITAPNLTDAFDYLTETKRARPA